MAKKIPMRMCVGCRAMKVKRELIRIVRSEDGIVSLDVTGKANGRGAYVCADAQCLQKAVKTKALERALQTQISPETIEQLTNEIAKRGDIADAE